MLSRIPDPKKTTKERGGKMCFPLFVATNITIFKKKNFFEQVKKKIWANLQRISV
jgi:hypothetical protein